MIPKIIHHFAPENKEYWHPVWHKCLDSWLKHFPKPEYEHKFWYNDNSENDDIAKFIREEYSEYKKIYDEFPTHIMKLDFARYLVIHKYGGLYVDMDVFCYKNFYDMLNNDIILFEISIKILNNILFNEDLPIELENLMLGGKKNNNFFIQCVEQSILKFFEHKDKLFFKKKDSIYTEFVHAITGDDILTNVYKNYDKKMSVNILSRKKFNQHLLYYDDSIITKHMKTGLWGKEDVDFFIKNKKHLSYNFLLKNIYLNCRKIDIDNFDFYKNYLEQ